MKILLPAEGAHRKPLNVGSVNSGKHKSSVAKNAQCAVGRFCWS